MSAPAVSVVVAFYNEGRHLPALLESLAQQDLAEAWELLAADNRSTDDSRSVLTAYSNRLTISIVDAFARPNPAYARNMAVKVARSDKLIFIDADDEVSPNYLSAMAAALDDHPYVTSRVDSESLNPTWVHKAHGEPWQTSGIDLLLGFLPGTGANVGLRREAFEGLGGFPEEYPYCEDIALSWLAHQQGMPVHFVREADYKYRYRDSLRRLFRQSANWGLGNTLLYRNFRSSGMPARPMSRTIGEWAGVGGGLLRRSTQAERAAWVVRAGYCWGRVRGSLRYGVIYL